MFPRRLRALLKLGSQRFLENLGLLLRLGFCFVVGIVVLFSTQNSSYDSRFALRGKQDVAEDILIVQLSREDVGWMDGLSSQNSKNVLWSLKEIVETSDSFFWHPAIWEKALNVVLAQDPKAIIVTLFFGDETVRGTMSYNQQKIFSRSNIFWGAKADSDGHAITSGLARADGKNTGVLELRSDPDGRIRHFLTTSHVLPHISVRVRNYLSASNSPTSDNTYLGEPINFQGPRGTFLTVPFSDLLKGKIAPATFANKIVIFSVKDIPAHQVQTPLGSMSSGELLANLIYEFTHFKEIRKIPFSVSLIYLFFVCLITLWIVFEYPQSVALVFLCVLAVGLLALSAALFDLKTLWIPASAPLACIIATYVLISGYRLSESEKLSWESERELHYLSEVESLKNNFLSLISHDLKNPLAKIQGITDRMLAAPEGLTPQVAKEDLLSIKRTSEELRQYIGSILQLTRVEARDVKLTKEVCDINMIVENVVSRIAPLAQQKNIEVKQNLEPIFSIEVDRTLITEVLLNLVENAVKYSDPGSVIGINTLEIDDYVRVEVTDTGGGIPEEEIPKVFDKFYRGTGQKTLEAPGTGLGLYLVKYFIELHGGKVFISSQMGKGTKVSFTLPLDALPEEKYAEFTRAHR